MSELIKQYILTDGHGTFFFGGENFKEYCIKKLGFHEATEDELKRQTAKIEAIRKENNKFLDLVKSK